MPALAGGGECRPAGFFFGCCTHESGINGEAHGGDGYQETVHGPGGPTIPSGRNSIDASIEAAFGAKQAAAQQAALESMLDANAGASSSSRRPARVNSKVMSAEARREIHERLADIEEKDLFEAAKKHLRKTGCTVYNEQSDDYEQRPLWNTTPAQIGIYGVGLELYFELLLMLILVFLAMFVVSLPVTIMCLMGSMVEDVPAAARANIFYRIASYFTVGNLGTCKGCNTLGQMEERLLTAGSSLKVRDVSIWLGILDGAALLVFLGAGVAFIHWWVPRAVAKQDANHVTAADFAVRVDDLPRRLPGDLHAQYEDELRRHFESVLVDAGFNEPDGIKEVALVREYDGSIMKFMAQGELLEQWRNSEVALIKARRCENAKDIKKFEKLVHRNEQKCIAMEAKLEHQASLRDVEREVCFAFLMFRTETIKNAVLYKFRLANAARCLLCLQRHKRRFHNHPITVTQAGEPTDLNWENLDYSWGWHMARRGSTCLLAILLVVLTFPLLVALRSVLTGPDTSVMARDFWVIQPTAKDGGCMRFCELSLGTQPSLSANARCGGILGAPLEVYSERGREANASVTVLSDGSDSCAAPWESVGCSGNEVGFIGLRLPSPEAVKCVRVVQDATNFTRELSIFACEFEPPGPAATQKERETWMVQNCLRLSDIYAHGAVDNMQIRRSKLCLNEVPLEVAKELKASGSKVDLEELNCFCQQQSDSIGYTFKLGQHGGPETDVCWEWISSARSTIAKQVLGVLAVLLLNQILLLIFMYLDKWARYQTQTDLANSQMFNLFLSQLFNTAITFTVVGADFHGTLDGVLPEWLRIGHGPYDHFDTEWFTTIGILLFTTFICQVACATATPIIFVKMVDPLLRRFMQKGVVTQVPLNDIYTLPDWTLSLRLSETITIVFCLMMYSSSMPLLYLVGAGYCALAYWCDKWSLLRGSRQPPAYDAKSISRAVMLLPLAAVLHTFIALVTYGQQDVVPSDWGFLSGLTQLLFGMDLEKYARTTSVYNDAGSDVKEQYYFYYFQSRFLDFGRSSTVFPFIILLAFLIYYFMWGILRVFQPLLVLLDVYGFEGEKYRFCFRRKRAADTGEFVTKETYDEAKVICAWHELVFSYKLDANPRYKEAHDALQYDPDPEKLQAFLDARPAWQKMNEAATDLIEQTSSKIRSSIVAGILQVSQSLSKSSSDKSEDKNSTTMSL